MTIWEKINEVYAGLCGAHEKIFLLPIFTNQLMGIDSDPTLFNTEMQALVNNLDNPIQVALTAKGLAMIEGNTQIVAIVSADFSKNLCDEDLITVEKVKYKGLLDLNSFIRTYGENLHLVEGDFQGANLERANLRNCNLRGANLVGTNFSRADLKGADLSDTNCQGCNLYRANLRESNLDDADLRRANLSQADLTSVSVKRTALRGAELWATFARDVDFTEAFVDGVDLSRADTRGK